MKVIGIIPARYNSQRFKGKLLAPLGDKPVIEWTWLNVKKSKKLDDLIIATDDKRIFEVAQSFGAKVIMTSSKHKSGTDRVAEVAEQLDAQIIVNIQADEPLLHYSVIDSLVEAMDKDPKLNIVTPIKKINNRCERYNENISKVVIDKDNFALYFSRSSIPYLREELFNPDHNTFYKHLGIYAYTKDFLLEFTKLPKSYLERVEKLEQLRILEAGYKIKTIITEYDSIGIDTKKDLLEVFMILYPKQVAECISDRVIENLKKQYTNNEDERGDI